MVFRLRKKSGLIGLGIIGSRVAQQIRKAGYQLYVWNRTPKPEPNFVGSPKEIAEAAKFIQIFVSDHKALDQVLESMLPALTPSHVILNHATISPEHTLAAYEKVRSTGAQFLDAPFTGSKSAAEQAALVYYIGENEDSLKSVKPLLEISSTSIIPIGKVGQASAFKIAANMLIANTVQSLSESLAIAARFGVSPDDFAKAITPNAVHSKLLDMKIPGIRDADYSPHFSLNNMLKDLHFAIQMASQHNLDLPNTSTTTGILLAGQASNWGNLDFSAIARNFFSTPSSNPPESSSPQPAPNELAETPKAETPKAETPKAETPKAETPKAETPKAETPKAETPKVETPKVETPKVETPKVETPKVETPKVDKAETPSKKPGFLPPATPLLAAKPLLKKSTSSLSKSETMHSDPAHSEPVHSDPIHAEPVHSESAPQKRKGLFSFFRRAVTESPAPKPVSPEKETSKIKSEETSKTPPKASAPAPEPVSLPPTPSTQPPIPDPVSFPVPQNHQNPQSPQNPQPPQKNKKATLPPQVTPPQTPSPQPQKTISIRPGMLRAKPPQTPPNP